MKPMIALAVLLTAVPAMAQNYTQHDAHEHGVGALNIAMSGDQLAMELTASGADIIGFEYPASSAEEKHAIEEAIAQLSMPLELIRLPSAAQCNLVSAEAHLAGEEHDDHAEEHHDNDAEQHTEFHAEYLFECADIGALQNFAFPYFHIFPKALELAVQIVNDSGALAFAVERAEPQLEL